MGLPSSESARRRIVVDNIHSDITLTEQEWRVVNTASFQRLRSLKQLGMGHLVYPNATHTRFAHSLGVFAIMCRIVRMLKEQNYALRKHDFENLRLAALLHDIGHYPYSHLMERIDRVTLTEEEVDDNVRRPASAARQNYPNHEELGRRILDTQSDLREAVGGKTRARDIGVLFSRTEAAHPELSELIHSSLDMDRLDYLLRDARAAGVPYGEIDLNYLLNNIRVSPNGVLGIEHKALAAAEHFLIARLFMHRVVYYHKTIYGFEEACRQLLRRVRDQVAFEILADGKAVLEYCSGPTLPSFTDDYVDRIVRRAAAESNDPVIQTLARCITSRHPPKLLVEISELQEEGQDVHAGALLRTNCKARLKQLADKYDIPLGQFLYCTPKPIRIEERSPLLTREEAKELKAQEREELIMVFTAGSREPTSIVDVKNSVAQHLSAQLFGIHRLYLADLSPHAEKRLKEIKTEVQKWIKP